MGTPRLFPPLPQSLIWLVGAAIVAVSYNFYVTAQHMRTMNVTTAAAALSPCSYDPMPGTTNDTNRTRLLVMEEEEIEPPYDPELAKHLSCFKANYQGLHHLLSQNVTLPKPVLNVGMPKVGSTALFQFFRCSGWRASHWQTKRQDLLGMCMQRAYERNESLLESCDSWRRPYESYNRSLDVQAEAFLQMDAEENNGNCVFPQMEYLDQLHAEAPNATLVLLFRPMKDWARSMVKWAPEPRGSMALRLSKCDLPGLPLGKGNSTQDMIYWWCWHVQRIRKFVQLHPSHTLIELDLYHTEINAQAMAQLFGSKTSCWGHANKNVHPQPSTEKSVVDFI